MQFYIIPENNFNFHTFFASFANFFGNKFQIVRRHQRKLRSIPHSLDGPAVGSAVQMAVAAQLHLVSFQHGQDLRALVALIQGRIVEKTELFLHISVSFFPMLGLLCILRYTIQGVGYTNLAMFSGVSEMIARILVSIYAVPAFGFIAVCYGDPMAWIAADLFLIPAFIYVYRRLKRQVLTSAVA